MNDAKKILDDSIRKYGVTVGSYHELVTKKDCVRPFVDVLNNIGIRITRFMWWCCVDENHKEEHHGGGGYRDQFGSGWFSELYYWNDLVYDKLDSVKDNNQQYVDYYFNVLPSEKRYLPCAVPGIEIDVPANWHYELDRE